LPAGISEDDVSQLVAITGKPREMAVMALQLAQGNLDMACSIIFEGLSL
jgi:NACalpha-BTF3-like transcription factor